MLQRIAPSHLFLLLALLAASCQPTASTHEENTAQPLVANPQTSPNAATPSSNASPALVTPTAAAPCPTPAPDANRKIVINAPCDGSKVAPRQFVEGVVTIGNAQVWVVIHPMKTADYWTQPAVTVRDEGKWKVLCYFGEPGQLHANEHYEVMAFASPKTTLKEGQLLANWPDAQSKSQVIEVIRQ